VLFCFTADSYGQLYDDDDDELSLHQPPRASTCVLICYVFIVQGRHLQRGSRLVDFDIKLGDALCDPVSLTDNQVDCKPPTIRPKNHANDTFCPRDTLSLHVSV